MRVDGRPPRRGTAPSPGRGWRSRLEDEDPRPVPQPELPLTRAPRGRPAGRSWTSRRACRQPSAAARASAARWRTRWSRATPSAPTPRTTRARAGWSTGSTRDLRRAARRANPRDAWRAVREAFGGREVDKRYLALVTGPLADEGEIDLPLRHRARPRGAGARAEGDARHSPTSGCCRGPGTRRWSRCRILTGVLHQIRAHLAAIGAPIVGDTLYGGRAQPGLSRFFLHAARLGLQHPATGSRLEVVGAAPGRAPPSARRALPGRRRLMDTVRLARDVRSASLHGSEARAYPPPGGMGLDDARRFGRYIRQLREERGLTQSELATAGGPGGGQREAHRARAAQPLPAERREARGGHGGLASLPVRRLRGAWILPGRPDLRPARSAAARGRRSPHAG